MSLDDQEDRLKDFCSTEGNPDNEYYGTHELVGPVYKEEVSGSTYPFGEEREEFGELVEHLEQDESIDGIVVWEFDRLARDSIRQVNVKDKLRRYHVGREIEIMQIDPWMPPYRSIPPVFPDELKKADQPMIAYNLRQVFMLQGNSALWEMLMTSKRTTEGLHSKKERDEHIGNPPWGITTDKVLYELDESKHRLPIPEERPEQIEPKNHQPFSIAVAILNEQATVGDPNEHGTADGLWSYAKDKGMGSPSSTIKRMWNNRDDYRKALQNARDHGFADDFDLDGIQVNF